MGHEVLQRVKNPINWVLGILLFTIFCYSLWYNDITQSVVVGLAMIPFWFLFPKPKKGIKWVDRLVDAGISWWSRPMDFDKAILYVTGFAAFVLFIYTMWVQDAFHAILSFLVIILVKYAAFREVTKKSK